MPSPRTIVRAGIRPEDVMAHLDILAIVDHERLGEIKQQLRSRLRIDTEERQLSGWRFQPMMTLLRMTPPSCWPT